MEMQEKPLRTRQERYRETRAQKGESQMQIWLNEDLHRKIDEAVKTGGFKNRSELISLAVDQLIKGRQM